jgi:Acetoacetate decarboxylase (ADC)
MSYPQTPWTLKGSALLTLNLIDVDKVRHLVPSELNIISALPGKTIGGVYFSNYASGSVLEYNELIVVPAVVSYQGKFGAWVSHIYVDNPDSVAGGREIWGLPKELAEFSWLGGDRITVRQNNKILCSLNYDKHSFAWRQSLSGSSFSTMNSDLLIFSAKFESLLGFVGSKLEVPVESPFSFINLGQPFLTVRCEDMTLKVAVPSFVG